MSQAKLIKELQDRIQQLERKVGVLQAKHPHRSIGKKHHAMNLKDTVVPGRNA